MIRINQYMSITLTHCAEIAIVGAGMAGLMTFVSDAICKRRC